MATTQLFIYVTAVSVLCLMLCKKAAQQCASDYSATFGMMLQSHTYRTLKTSSVLECRQACNSDFRCHSFNYVFIEDLCELNNRTKEARPADFVPDVYRYYFRGKKELVPLGSIPKMPAESCKEIKLNEGGQASSGKYWFDSLILGEVVLAQCNMETEDVDECSASMSVCSANSTGCKNTEGSYVCTCAVGFSGRYCTDIDECSASVKPCDANANCQNTHGAYACSCKAGFSGDGKTCADVDECSASGPVCDLNANCENTVGSYLCFCKTGYFGDGKTCTDYDECDASVVACALHASCQNIAGSFVCSCKSGFTGDGRTCNDFNECTAPQSVCDVNANCQNIHGSYLCTCKTGFIGDGRIRNCSDVDECTAVPSVCNVNANCQNTEGTYVCACKAGFTGDGKNCTDMNECGHGQICDINANCQNTYGSYSCSCKNGFIGDGKTCADPTVNSCNKILQNNPAAGDGIYSVALASSAIPVYCDMAAGSQGWILIARFSNNDNKNWMNDSGWWWYDKVVAAGKITDPSSNTDMISPAFWMASGSKFKITRSDDPQHTPLLLTTGNCLGGQTFRSKMTSYGNFRNGIVWASNKCQGSCSIQYGGQYQTTDGFTQAACSSDIQNANKIGFWCDWSTGDGAVLMIGGGGASCSRADHGIGITEANAASFVFSVSSEADFGHNNYATVAKNYALNLWIL